MFRVLVAVMLVCSAGAGGVPPPDQPRILEVYPNPVAYNDDGEFVTVWIPAETDAELTLADDEATARLTTNATVTDNPTASTGLQPCMPAGTGVTYSTGPNLTASLTDRRVAPLPRLRLANEGERLRLRRGGTLVDEIRYSDAPSGAVYHRTTGRRVRATGEDAADERPPRSDAEWRPLGATDRRPVTAGAGNVTAFVLPDDPDRAVDLLEDADRRILLAGYTLSSERVVEELIAAHERGVDVHVLVDGSPVGGISTQSVTALDRLARNDVSVTVLAGERKRYRFHHAKYAVIDDRALVTTENWKPSGTGGNASRGWGVVTDQRPVVSGLVDLFRDDSEWADGVPWDEYDHPTAVESNRANGTYPTEFPAESVTVEQTRLLVAPDNAETELVAAIDGADESLDVKQVSVGGPNVPVMRATLDAAGRGVEVRLLLSGAWYVEEENRELARQLERRASEEGLPLEVRIAEPNGAYGKIHAKGLVVDDERVYLGSANWNNNSLQHNREVVLLLAGEEPASYYGAVFDHDWEGGSDDFPVGVVLACTVLALVAIAVARRVNFEK